MAQNSNNSNNNNRQEKTDFFEMQEDLSLDSEELVEVWARRAYELALEPPAPVTGKTLDLLVFWLGKERYGVPVSYIREIYPLEQLTPVPRTPSFVAGVFSARGRILSVIDLSAFFELPAIKQSAQTKIIVVADSDLSAGNMQRNNILEVGILADEVADVVTIFKEDIQPPLTTHTGLRAEYIQGITSDLLVVLNLDALLSDHRLIIQEELL